MNPLVSIACITYNHEPYIRQCLDGFVMQQTDFEFEIVIHDDASTDGTRDVILEYCSKYPHLFRTIFQKKNRYKEGKGIFVRFVFPICLGKYIAMCEGDDYWTDPYKLQKQVDFLKDNQKYVICGHEYNILYQSNLSNSIHRQYGAYDLNDFVTKQIFCSTLTVVFKKDAIDFERLSKYPHVIDSILFFHLLKKGDGYCLKDNMAVYRVHCRGVWSTASHESQMIMDLTSRLSLCQFENSVEAASFLKILFNKPISRKFMLKHSRLIIFAMYYLSKSFGLREALVILWRKFFCKS